MPLRVHGTYALDEVMAAFHVLDRSGSVFRLREGVKRVEAHRCDLLFITLEKTAADYSPTTMYDDYAIGPASFHWQSQSGTHGGTKTGQRYIHHARTDDRVLLFVRRRRKDTRRETCPYVFLGEADYVEHHGGRPMSITWALRRPMPARLYQSIKVAAG